jgi:TolB-like protein/DNA-binding winged helix-turn-helix (wHTH) protein/Flp pilus assembly protein TadD
VVNSLATERVMQPQAYDSKIVCFGVFQVDLHAGELYRAGLRVKLQQQPLQVLTLLLERSGTIVTREELRTKLWPTDTFVDFEHSLNTAVRKLRDALGDVAENPIFVETIPRKGYRFIAPLEMPESAALTASAQTLLPQTLPMVKPEIVDRNRNRATVFLLALATVMVLLGTVGWKIMRDGRLAHGNAPQIKSLAVLPLVNLSGDPEQEYFADGLTEALTTDLAKFRALRVISRTSVMQYKGSKKTVPEIAGDLNVDAVIEGTVLRSGNHVRITVNLVQARPEMHLWAENYETEAGDLLGLQANVAQAVAREIQITVTPPEQLLPSRHTVDPIAQDLYFRGLRAAGPGTGEAAQNAIDYFQQSIQKDPTYAPAYAALADVYSTWYPGESRPREKMPMAREAARKALALDETLPSAHNVMGFIELCYDWNWVGAEKEFKRALELDPNHVPTHNNYARELVILGRTDEGLAHIRTAASLDPYSTAADYPIWVTYLARRYDEAVKLAKAGIALDTNNPWNHYDLALVYEQTGKTTEAVQEYVKFESLSGTEPQTIARLQDAFGKSGPRGFWRQRLEEYRKAAKSQYVSAGVMAGACTRVGEKDCTFEWLDKAFQARDDLMINLNVDPVFDGIRANQRFQDLLRRVGVPH